MSKFTKLLALMLVLAMVLSFAACNKPNEDQSKTEESAPAESTEESTTPAIVPEGTLVYVTSEFDQKFSPFFYTTA
ncbi:MAG: hypothetical protein J5793_02020, partial [Clostridia bacterium]|nr:hypothetical protein [Clostridia bacterium]